jgi:hypothetical protein
MDSQEEKVITVANNTKAVAVQWQITLSLDNILLFRAVLMMSEHF